MINETQLRSVMHIVIVTERHIIGYGFCFLVWVINNVKMQANTVEPVLSFTL